MTQYIPPELECEGQTTSQNADEDEEFEKELDQMIENIKDEEVITSDIVCFV